MQNMSTMAAKFKAVAFLLFTLLCFWLLQQTEGRAMVSSIFSGKRSWHDIAAARRKAIHGKIPKEWLLSPKALDEGKKRIKITGDFIESLLDTESRTITGMDAVEIVATVGNGSMTAVQIITAFCKRAAFAHQLNNNLLEIAFDMALDRAAELDRYWEANHETVGPLHGLPVTMKDQFHIKGTETSMAYVGFLGTFEGVKGSGKEKVVESELVKELYSLGAIPIAKTSLVQTLWYGETNNNILGYTMNPWNQGLSCGGSSGGEGALQALGGSPIGFGTDIGGSVSMPAAFNNLYSIKPSTGRLSYRNVATSSPGQVVIPSVVGILSPSLPSLRLMLQSLLSTRPWLHDPEVINLPWRESEYRTKEDLTGLSFGLMESDGIVTPQPPISRALRIVSEALQKKGHMVTPWEPPSHSESAKIHPSFTQADGAADVFERLGLSGEPLIPELQHQFGNAPKPPIPLLDFYNNALRLKDYRERYQEYWSSTANVTETGRPVDAVILPVGPHAAVIPGKYYHYTYSSVVNVLDYTSIVIPVTFADSKVDVFDHNYKPLNDKDRKNWLAYPITDDPEKYNGAPAAIQLLGRRLDEERLLSIAQAVADALKDFSAKAGKP